MKPLNVFEFVNNLQKDLDLLTEQKAHPSLIRKAEIKLDSAGEVMQLLKLWIKYLEEQEDKPSLSTMALLKEIVNS